MPPVSTKQETINAIIKEVESLDKSELQILLTQLRVKKLQKTGVKPAANYKGKKIKPPTMEQIDKWKHESRKLYAGK
ncbi:MAG: hypothetical protein JST21_08115 [Bacteroidetes bacterium]|nr:hypothetical protein [Bacteroidota bacterium]